MTYPTKRNLRYKNNKIIFYQKKNIDLIPIMLRKTPTGYIKISSPGATFLDLIQFNRKIGGLETAALVGSELKGKIGTRGFKTAATQYPIQIIQRAGYILEQIGSIKNIESLKEWLNKKKPVYTYLNPSSAKDRIYKNHDWKIIVNDSITIPE
jgi:predicted transcriptional regulator of viral defense system